MSKRKGKLLNPICMGLTRLRLLRLFLIESTKNYL